jgi:crossover junction endodeoxyribonuclease RusA
MIMLYLPYPPSGNHMWKHAGGKHYLTKQAMAYYSQVAYVIAQAGMAMNLEDRLHVEVDVYPPDKRRRDLSNVIKVLEDACTKAGLWQDDSQIDSLVIKRMAVMKGGAIGLRLEPIGAEYATVWKTINIFKAIDMAHGGRRDGAGRKAGVPNKINSDVKEMILGALQAAGGKDYLTEQAITNPTAFLSLVGKVVPKDVSVDQKGNVTLTVVTNVPMND